MTFRLRRAWRAGATAICGALLAGCVGIGGNTFDGGAVPSHLPPGGAVETAPITPRASAAPLPPNCAASRAAAVARLKARYGELQAGGGTTASGALLEVLTTPDGATWSIIVTVPDGPTCLVSSGTGWRALDAALQGPEI